MPPRRRPRARSITAQRAYVAELEESARPGSSGIHDMIEQLAAMASAVDRQAATAAAMATRTVTMAMTVVTIVATVEQQDAKMRHLEEFLIGKTTTRVGQDPSPPQVLQPRRRESFRSRRTQKQRRLPHCKFCGGRHAEYVCQKRHDRCFRCGQLGHFRRQCPN